VKLWLWEETKKDSCGGWQKDAEKGGITGSDAAVNTCKEERWRSKMVRYYEEKLGGISKGRTEPKFPVGGGKTGKLCVVWDNKGDGLGGQKNGKERSVRDRRFRKDLNCKYT